jgi:hypothetical protein
MDAPALRRLAAAFEAKGDIDRAIECRNRATIREAGPHHPLEHLFHDGDVVLGAGRSASGAIHVQASYDGGWPA